jgi:hypothetical protein
VCKREREGGGERDKMIHYRADIFIGTLLHPSLLVQKDGVSGRRVLLNGMLCLDPIGRIL